MPASGDFAKLRGFNAALTRLSRDELGLTRAAMDATRLLSEHVSEQESDPTGRNWAALSLSTLQRRRAGPKLLRIYRSRRWQIMSRGRWRVFNDRKPHDVFHTTGTRNMPARPDLPVMPGGMLAYQRVIHEALAEHIGDTFKAVGLQ